MTHDGHMDARTLRSRLSHPVIDADGHWLEYSPVMREEFRKIGGDAAAEAFAIQSQRIPDRLEMSLEERRRRRFGQEAFWGSPCENVLDRATAMMPRLMYERLDDLGIDVCVVYPTAGLSYHRMQDTRLRRAICRAYNVFTALRLRRPRGREGALLRRRIGHFDVPDMAAVVPEAYELVEHELLTDEDFRDFMFVNAVRFWGEVNPDFFFEGTVVEKQAAAVLATSSAAPGQRRSVVI